jgi:hypothetical protein
MAGLVSVSAGKAALVQEKAKIERLERAWGRRKVCAGITSCLCSSCTFFAICIPSVLCHYCICHCLLFKKRDLIEEVLHCCQCMMFDAPPENVCQLACTFCTPLVAGDMPEQLNYYSTPPERQTMEETAKKIEETLKILES